MTRDKQINFRVSEDEAARFDRVAEHYGLAMAAMIRMLVKEKGRYHTGTSRQAWSPPDWSGKDGLGMAGKVSTGSESPAPASD
jgi:hypothetical protein